MNYSTIFGKKHLNLCHSNNKISPINTYGPTNFFIKSLFHSKPKIPGFYYF